MMALAVDQGSGNIYVGNTRIWGVGNASIPKIYKLDAITGAVSTHTTLTGGLGIGYLTIDNKHDQIFASNYDDGKIYRINLTTGAVIDTYDYGSPGSITGGAAPTSENGRLV